MKIYKNINDLPAWNFNEINTTGDFIYLFSKNNLLNRLLKFVLFKILDKYWTNIWNEFLSEFGLNDNFKLHLEKEIEIINHYYNAYIDGKKHELNFAKIKEVEVENMMKGESMRFSEIFALMMKNGFNVRLKEASVREFYSYIKIMKNGN